MWGITQNRAKNGNKGKISFVDVKELYDTAYAEKEKARVNLRKFKKLMDQAIKMDEAYRQQLMHAEPFSYRRAA